MAQIRAHEFDQAFRNETLDHGFYLVYGPDRGLVSERAERLVRLSTRGQDDPFSLSRLDSASLATDPGRLFDEAQSVSLFGAQRTIWLKGVGNERKIVDALIQLLSTPPPDTVIVVEAGDLKKSAALRKQVEATKPALAIPCYADDSRSIQTLINEEMTAANLTISPQARHRLVEILGGDRLASRAELRKLALYCDETGEVDEEDVIAALGDAAGLSHERAVDAVLTGNLAQFDRDLQRIIASRTSIYTVLQGLMRQFQLLDLMHAEVASGKATPAAILASRTRSVHFKRKPAIEQAFRASDGALVARALMRLDRTILDIRRRPHLEEAIARTALLAILLQMRR